MEPMLIETLPKLLKRTAEKWPDIYVQMSRENGSAFKGVTYSECFQLALDFGAGLLNLGLKRGDRIGLMSDNRKEWFQADMGLMAVGLIDVPRGCDASPQDISYILSFTECSICIAENSLITKKILSVKQESLPLLKTLILFDKLDDETYSACADAGITVLYFADILEQGREFRKNHPALVEEELEKGTPDELATLIFTSGTTGIPKGVMLSHRNFFIQLDELRERIWVKPGEKALMVLPVWHVYERSVEYVIFCQGGTLCYSKPVGAVMMPDLAELNPALLPAVPRVFEAIYDAVNRSMKKTGGIVYALYRFFVKIGIMHNKIQRSLLRKNPRFCYDFIHFKAPFLFLLWLLLLPLKSLGQVLVFKKIQAKLGNSFRGGIAGGGAYPEALDNYFNGIGVKIVEGYGLTETAPIITVRPMNDPIFGTIGRPLRGIQARIVDENGNVLGKCKKGILEIKGDNVMKGYYKRPELTAKVLSEDGWLNTGDLAITTITGEIILKGRVKDTIVLRGGENVEPLPIEQAIMQSTAIKTVVVTGQDQRALTCLIVPDKEEILSVAENLNLPTDDYSKLLKSEEIHKFLQNEISSRVNKKNGFKPFEIINKFTILEKDFEVGKELSSKQDISRFKICEIYKKEIEAMYK